MKKVSLLAAAMTLCATSIAHAEDCAPTPPPGCPKAFQGFFLGGNLGYITGGARTNLNQSDGTGVTSQSVRTNPRGLEGGLNAGYNQRLGFISHALRNWGTGVEFVANWGNASSTSQYVDNDTNNLQEGVFKVRRKNAIQVRGNLFYVICEKVAPKVFLGWDNAKIARKNTITNVGTFKHSKRHNGFLWGAGVDFLMSRHVIMGFEYAGSASNQKSNHWNTTSNNTHRSGGYSVKPQFNTFALTAKVIY